MTLFVCKHGQFPRPLPLLTDTIDPRLPLYSQSWVHQSHRDNQYEETSSIILRIDIFPPISDDFHIGLHSAPQFRGKQKPGPISFGQSRSFRCNSRFGIQYCIRLRYKLLSRKMQLSKILTSGDQMTFSRFKQRLRRQDVYQLRRELFHCQEIPL